ncbi:hypothetical protein LG201_12035 [Methylobacillus gramineus]|uniref:hypothetical protein n=1 Tax=Methylobacillus gramineus TaxID=755169 RepID=UPI001CFF9635|nr:hypothetical protein [Methylobacillus gramineus]MCB5185933.1 hypothetical protein [Methylobacillus gramineus]
MLKRLRIYYFYAALPFVLLLLGAAFYHNAILKTLVENPHPQINYVIFFITLLGGILILMTVHRLLKEAARLDDFTSAIQSGEGPAQLQDRAQAYDGDIAYVLRMMATSSGRGIAHQEQVAIDAELNSAGRRLVNRNALPQFLTSLLVGLGLLGTFIGLLATLDDIASLISSFATVNLAVDSPVEVFRDMVARMRAPMRSMGIAFSASLYGLLGSIILGFMMVAVRRCSQEVLSLLGSEVAQHIEQALTRTAVTQQNQGNGLVVGGAEPVVLDSVGGLIGTGGGHIAGMDPAELKFRREIATEEIRVLRRIEERLSESSRLQDRALQAELDNFSKQRSEMMRAMADHNESVSQFRGELQRVGRQLGTILSLMERGNADMLTQLNDHFSELIQTTVRQGTDLARMSDMMTRMTDDSMELRTNITEMMGRFSPAEQRALMEGLLEEANKQSSGQNRR